jgi:hypothetical protein
MMGLTIIFGGFSNIFDVNTDNIPSSIFSTTTKTCLRQNFGTRDFADIFGIYTNIAFVNTFGTRAFANIFGIHNDSPLPTL